MTTTLLLKRTDDTRKELKRQLTANPGATRIVIEFSSSEDNEDVSLRPLIGRPLDLLDLQGLDRFHDLNCVNTKVLKVTIDHLVADLVFLQPSYDRLSFAPDVIEVHLWYRQAEDYYGDTIPLTHDETDKILQLHKNMREHLPKGVIIVVWNELEDCGGGQSFNDHEHKVGSDILWYNRHYSG